MRRRQWTFGFIIATLIGTTAGGGAAGPDIPPHPDEIVFSPLAFEPPKAADFRHILSNGVPVYLAPTHEFPLINAVFSFKGADDLDGPEERGLATATGAMIRRGGTTSVSAEDLDEEFDFLAARRQAARRRSIKSDGQADAPPDEQDRGSQPVEHDHRQAPRAVG